MAESQGNYPFPLSFSEPARGARYFCHQCSLEVQPEDNSADLTCPNCDGGFIEEMEVGNGHRETESSDPDRDIDESVPQPFMGFGGHGHTHMHSPRPGTFVLSMSSGPSHRGARSGIPILFHGGVPAAPTAAHAAHRHPPGFEALFSLLGNLGGGLNLAMPGVHGNPGDYVWGTGGLDAIITQLLNNVEGAGPPPAEAERIEKLPTVKITSLQVERNVECSVCFDDFTLDEEVKVLPCKHHYHKDCIVPWLEMHGTCPVCRIDLNGSDTTTTEFDANIGETIGSIETDPQNEYADEAQASSQNTNNSAAHTSDSSNTNTSRRRQTRSRLRDDDID